MLPNSRIIPPNNNARRRSSSVILDSNTFKKGFISRLLTKDQPTSPPMPTHDIQRPKFDTALGIQKDEYPNQPHIRPIQHQQSKKHNKIPLAPPPNYPRSRAISQPNQQQFLTNLPDHLLTKRPTVDPILIPTPLPNEQDKTELSSLEMHKPTASTSTSSLRKSSGSCSIYSTFGGDESIYSIDDDSQRQRYSSNSVACESESSFTTVVSHQQNFEEDEDEEADVDSITTTTDDDDDDFVDATGVSQEDIEREKRLLNQTSHTEQSEENNSSLTKRLSGGHFGSAGGLVVSIQKGERILSSSPPAPPPPTIPIPPVPPIPQQHNNKRKNQKLPADDDLAKSMLNWKRHSGNSKRLSVRSNQQTLFNGEDKHASTITVVDLRTAKQEREEEGELSVSDKMALRKEAEKALSGHTSTLSLDESSLFMPKSTSAPHLLSSLSLDSTLKAPHQLSDEFSKTLDDVWKTSDDTLHLFDDPKSKELHSTIKIHVADHDSAKIEVDLEQQEQEKIKNAALSLWHEDETIVAKEKMAEWLGQGKPFNSAVLYEYMKYFVFSDMRLDSAFRKLCNKLYFKAEAQQIDRILESFANRYWECNPNCLFGSADVVYAVVYSLLLLNTDLHVAQGNHTRMTRSEFIRNTMSTIRDQKDEHNSPDYRNWEAEVEYNLKEMYISVKHYQILQPLSRKTSLSKRGSILGSRRVIGIKRSVNSIIRKSGRESMLILDGQDQIITASPTSLAPSPPPTIPLPPSPAPLPRTSISSGYTRPLTPSSSIKSPRRDSFSSASSSAASLSSRCGSPHPTQSIMQYVPHATHLFSSRPPYFKEGLVMRKHLLENATQKARHREWKECFLEVGHEGELRMYALQDTNDHNKSLFRHSSTVPHFSDMKQHNKWATSSQLIGKIGLNHTLSNPLPPPGYNRQRPHVFALQQSDGGVYLFQVASAEQAQEWVMTCNYWAARESKEPLPGGVSNMEYGWGDCLNDVVMDLDAMHKGYHQKSHYYDNMQDPDSIMIQDWIPPTPTMVSSQLDEKEQFEALQKHLVYLNNEINCHRDIKSKILIKFTSKCHNYNKVLSNWEARSKYLLHDIIKYQNYCDALEKSIQKQQQLKPEEEQTPVEEVLTLHESIATSKLEYQSSALDLFKEINQELHLV
ncbi:hypothetical protein CU098_010544 [Rhizopus stolonifer]|uniref:SEC7 domain-containing protein n=1 Tax=Rhizopus stolonifer TaxID=4846 RepID=A0A367KXP7_RHIST|nr:hypothetical protein CU098_010544 [Rhizopus stolonifer]